MGHLVQMAGLAVQNFVSAAVGLAVAVALIRGFARARHRPDRQLLGRPRPRGASASCCRWPSPAPCCWWPWARSRTSPRATRPTTLRRPAPGHHRRPGRLAGGDQGARHQRRRLLQRQLGAPVREPQRAQQPVRDLPAAADPGRADPHVRRDGRGQAPGRTRSSRPWPCSVGALIRRRHRRRAAPPRDRARSSPAPRWRARRPGSACPASSLFAVSTTGTSTGAVDSFHYSYGGVAGGLLIFNMGLGEVAPGGVGSGLYGILVLAIVSGVRRRADGRAHAGVPAQEDHRTRDQARRALHPRHARSSC